jgi:hypothetical protein
MGKAALHISNPVFHLIGTDSVYVCIGVQVLHTEIFTFDACVLIQMVNPLTLLLL